MIPGDPPLRATGPAPMGCRSRSCKPFRRSPRWELYPWPRPPVSIPSRCPPGHFPFPGPDVSATPAHFQDQPPAAEPFPVRPASGPRTRAEPSLPPPGQEPPSSPDSFSSLSSFSGNFVVDRRPSLLLRQWKSIWRAIYRCGTRHRNTMTCRLRDSRGRFPLKNTLEHPENNRRETRHSDPAHEPRIFRHAKFRD